MLINTTSIQQQDHREMASSDAETDIKGSRVYFMMWSFSSYQKDDVVSISLCPSNLCDSMWLQLNIMKNIKHFFFLVFFFFFEKLRRKILCLFFCLIVINFKIEQGVSDNGSTWKKKIICCRFSNKESATKAICGVNGTVIGENMVKCSWGKESNDPNQSGGGAGSPSQMVCHSLIICHWLENCQIPVYDKVDKNNAHVMNVHVHV